MEDFTLKKCKIVIFILFLLIISITILWQFQVKEKDNALLQYSDRLNYTFTRWYDIQIYPIGEQKISQFIKNLNKSETDYAKVETISHWIVQNFTNCQWDNGTLCWDDSTNPNWKFGRKSLDATRVYWYDRNGMIRVLNGPFYDDPYWVAYYKTGACHELSVLFEEVAKRSGMETRRVRPNWDHEWNEVIIDNESRYVDLTIYWYYFTGDQNYRIKWTNKTQYFQCYTGYNVTKVFVEPSKVEVTENYPNNCGRLY